MRTRTIDGLLRGAAEREGVISFAGGLPDSETFPHKALAQAASDSVAGGSEALQYTWPEGRLPLRTLIASRMRNRGAMVQPEDIIITNGAQDALALAMEVIGTLEVQVSRVTYPGALDIFEGAQCAADSRRAQPVSYVMPVVSNPTGSTMTRDERATCLQSQVIIEDDAYAELLFSGPPPRPLLADAPDRVYFIGTFSKTLCPGLRVGWLIAPARMRTKVLALKATRDLQACGLSQALVERLLALPEFEPRLEKLRAHYRQRCDRLIDALVHVPGLRFSMPKGGFSVWVETELPGSDASWLYAALENGVAFDPGRLFQAEADPGKPLAMRLSFSSVPIDQIAAGVARLDKTLRSSRTRPIAA
jgi:2-aminoadipate transaminase